MITIKTLFFTSALAGFTLTSNAASVVNFVDVFGHNEKTNFGGTIDDMINGSGVDGGLEGGDLSKRTGDPADWTVAATATAYQGEWQSGDQLRADTGDFDSSNTAFGVGVGPTNSKIGWTIFDLGEEVVSLQSLYVWHVFENTGRQATDYNIYYSSSPTVAPFTGKTNSTSRDYDFSSGGWTSFGSGGAAGTTAGELETFNLSGISAQYIALEIITSSSDTSRVGFSEVAVTVVPEPSALALIGLAGMALLIRRRRG